MKITKRIPEIWKLHPTLSGIRVSNLGGVQTGWEKVRPNNKTGPCMELTGRWRTPVPYKFSQVGHVAVCLYTAPQGQPLRHKNYPIHALVLQTFVGDRPAGHCCCHNNGNPSDNRLENLRWDTPRGNSRDSIRHGTQPRGSRHGQSKLTEDAVKAILKLLFVEEPMVNIARQFGVTHPTISHIRAGKTWTHVPRPQWA